MTFNKALVVFICVANTLYAAALFNGHEAGVITQILDQLLIAALAFFAFWDK